MNNYYPLDKNLEEITKSYVKEKETTEISKGIIYEGIEYREIRFIKKNLSNSNKEALGLIFVDSDNRIVKDIILKRELNKRFYYYNIFLDSDKKRNMFVAILKESDLKKIKRECEIICNGLDHFGKKGLEEAKRAKCIPLKLPLLKVNNNNNLLELYAVVEAIQNNKLEFNDENFNKLYKSYIEMLCANIELANLMYSVHSNFGAVRAAFLKEKKNVMVRLNRKIYEPIYQANEHLKYCEGLLIAYEPILGMTREKYINFYEINERKNLKNRLDLNRI